MSVSWNKPFEVRDMRNGEWYWVQKEVLASKKINASDKLVYSALAYYSNQKSQSCYPSYDTLAELINISRRTVYSSISKLRRFKFIAVVKDEGKVNHYELLKITHANSAPVITPVQNSTDTRANQHRVPVQNSTTNNNYINNNNKQEEEEEVLIPSKTTNPLRLSRGQVVSFLKGFPTLTSTELKEQMKLCNNYMGMSSEKFKNPGLFFRGWLERYSKEKKAKQLQVKREAQQNTALPDLTEEEREKNFRKIAEIKARFNFKSI